VLVLLTLFFPDSIFGYELSKKYFSSEGLVSLGSISFGLNLPDQLGKVFHHKGHKAPRRKIFFALAKRFS
jgi:hypothetical protein